MSVVSINRNPDPATLRQFSEAGMFVLGMVLAPLSLARGSVRLALVWWIAAVLLRVVGVARPGALRPLFIGLSLATWPIGWVVSHAALAVTYYLVITPLALVFRLLGRDPLHRRPDPATTSYWEPYRPHRALERYLRQY